MRYAVALAALGFCLASSHVHARLFRQTYGATTPSADGGCAWNLNQDYFVPRHCDSGRYDLFSACKTSHTTSPACHHLHPIHAGYCTPYAVCRYRWRDHVYKTFCGCTPLRHTYGPWRLEKCRKPCFVLRGGHAACSACRSLAESCGVHGIVVEMELELCVLPNVEPFEGEMLGAVAVYSGGVPGGSNGGSTVGAGLPIGASAAVDQARPMIGIPVAPAAAGVR